MSYLHENGIIHRDLKCDNVLLFSLSTDQDTIRAKIADFGTASFSTDADTRGAVGTPISLAPEIVNDNQAISFASDVYAFAIVLWELWCEFPPFSEFRSHFAIFSAVKKGVRPPLPQLCLFDSLIELCWRQRPEERPSFSNIILEFERIEKSHTLEETEHKFNLFLEGKEISPFPPMPQFDLSVKDDERTNEDEERSNSDSCSLSSFSLSVSEGSEGKESESENFPFTDPSKLLGRKNIFPHSSSETSFLYSPLNQSLTDQLAPGLSTPLPLTFSPSFQQATEALYSLPPPPKKKPNIAMVRKE
jgi:serine/threonine protein kinase